VCSYCFEPTPFRNRIEFVLVLIAGACAVYFFTSGAESTAQSPAPSATQEVETGG
jgi:hypothetical protein